jgi:hypothetical protein
VPDVPKIDEFAFILLAGVLFIFILAFAWTTPTEGPPVVEQSHFEIDVAQGETTTFDFTVSSSTSLTSINITASGEIADWVTFNKNDFDIERDEVATVKVTVKVPSNASLDLYRGRVTVDGEGGTDTFSVSVDVVEEKEESATRLVSSEEFPSEFSVKYAQGTDVLDSRGNVRVSNGYLSQRSIMLTGLLTNEKLSITTGGSVHLIIESTNEVGNLKVSVNDNEIYNKRVSAGEIFIPIEKDLIEKTNVVTIKAGLPGWMFWTSTIYRIQVAEFNLDYEGAFAQNFNISMTEDEVDNFKQFNLFYRVPRDGYSIPIPELMIKINNQIVYWDVPPLTIFDRPLKEDMFGNPLYLNEGSNTITFMFEENAIYSVSEAMLTVEYYE